MVCALLLWSCSGGLRTDVDPARDVAGRESIIEDPAEIASITTRLSARDPFERAEAARTLNWVRPFATVEPLLIAALSDPEGDVRLAAVESLSRPARSDAVAEPILEMLDDLDPRVRAAAAFAVRDFREHSAVALAMALETLDEGDAGQRRSAAEQLQFLWPSLNDESLSFVVGLLDDPDPRIREIAALTVRKSLVIRRTVGIDPATEGLVMSLTAALSDDEAEIRRDAAYALESLGTAAASSLPVIEAALPTESDREASLALEAAARSVDPADRGRPSPVDTTIWWDAGQCIPAEDAVIAGLRPLDPESALNGLGRDRIALSSSDAWALTGHYVVIRHHYATFVADVAGGVVERIASREPAEAMRNGLRAGLTRDQVYQVLDITPTPEADEAGLFSIRICDVSRTAFAIELEFDTSDTVSEISVAVPAVSCLRLRGGCG